MVGKLYYIGPSTNSVVAWWSDSRKKISKNDRQCFDSIVVLICWLLWKERNIEFLIGEFVWWMTPSLGWVTSF